MKRILCMLICICMLLPLVGCSISPEGALSQSSESKREDTTDQTDGSKTDGFGDQTDGSKTDGSDDQTVGSELSSSFVQIKGFQQSGRDEYVYYVKGGKRAISIESYVTVDEGGTWYLSGDYEGTEIIESKQIDISQVENTCYVHATSKSGKTQVCTLKVIRTNYAKNNNTIKIGVSGPITGGAAMYGIAVKNSAQLAVDEINANGGINGIMLELFMLDDRHDPSRISGNYVELYEWGVQVSLGTVTTKPGLEFNRLSQADNLFFLTPSASGDGVPSCPNGFQMCYSDSNQGTASAAYFNENYVGKRIGVFYKADDEYSVGIKNNFIVSLDKSFGNPTVVSFTDATRDSFANQAYALKECDVIFMPIYYDAAAMFMMQGRGVVKDDAVYFGCDGFDGVDCVDGFDINSITQEVSMLSHFDVNSISGPVKAFVDTYREAFGKDAPLNQFGASAYDCVYAIYEALKVAVSNGEKISATIHPYDMCEILKGVFNSDDFVFRGITGECEDGERSYISWDENGCVNKRPVKLTVKEATSELD